MKMSIRKKALYNFLEKYKHTAEQGTQEWLNARRYRVGGSEISTVLGSNPYQNEKKLIKQHVGLDSFKGFAATFFGNLMEGILQEYINNYFDCVIYETGAINTDKNLGYSPDGLSIIKKQNLNKLLNQEHHDHIKKTSLFKDNHEDDDLLILFEFKCPFKRIPHDTEIPEYYLPQPLLGMEIINICEIGIFIEAIYRFCSLEDISYNNKYNNEYHSDKIALTNNPIYYGFMLITYNTDLLIDDEESDGDLLDQLESRSQFIHTIEQQLNKNNYIKTNINDKILNDLGKITNKWLFNQILEHIIQTKQFKYTYITHKVEHHFDMKIYEKNDKIKNVYNYDIITSVNKEIINEIEKLAPNERIIGILPYKLFNIYMKPVNKQLNFITPDIQNKVDNIIEIIKECYDGDKSIYEKEDIIDKYYPSKRKKYKSK